MRNLNGVGWAALMVFCAACATNTDRAEATAWEGPTPHFRLGGSYAGETLEFAIEGGEATNTATLSCSREYQAPLKDGELDLSKARLWEIKVNVDVTVKGERRALEIEFKKQDFSKVAPGATMAVIHRDDAALPGPGQLWFEWEWHDVVTRDTLDDRAAQQGSFVLGEFTGQPDGNGMIPDDTGTFGGFVTAKWSESETVTVSFTAKCGKNEIESDE